MSGTYMKIWIGIDRDGKTKFMLPTLTYMEDGFVDDDNNWATLDYDQNFGLAT